MQGRLYHFEDRKKAHTGKFKPLGLNLYLYFIKTKMGIWDQIAQYLFLKKKDPDRPKSSWVGYMHGINRLSIFLFIICLILIAIKLFTRH